METITNFFNEHGGNILIGFVAFYAICGTIMFIWMPSELKNAIELDDDFDRLI